MPTARFPQSPALVLYHANAPHSIEPHSANIPPASSNLPSPLDHDTDYFTTMARRGSAKMIEAVGNTSSGNGAGTKRVAGDTNEKRPAKRLKGTSTESDLIRNLFTPHKGTSEERLLDKPWSIDPDQVFRFMDLPGELRNRIYEFAAEWSRRYFPHTYPETKKFLPENHPAGDEYRRPAPKPLPFIGLTQACTVIRTEFRPLWLTTHRFPLLALQSYFKVFFPSPLRASKIDDQVRKRIQSYNNPTGTLRLWINKDSFEDVDIMPIFKFCVRYPAYTIGLVSGHPQITPERLEYLSTLINNANPIWIRNVKRHVITQVRLQRRHGIETFRTVVKQSHAPHRTSPPHGPVRGEWKDYVASLGVDEKMWNFDLGIDYS